MALVNWNGDVLDHVTEDATDGTAIRARPGQIEALGDGGTTGAGGLHPGIDVGLEKL